MWQLAHSNWGGDMTDPHGRDWTEDEADAAEEADRQERLKAAAQALREFCEDELDLWQAVMLAQEGV